MSAPDYHVSMLIPLLFSLVLSLTVSAQEMVDLRFLNSHKTLSNPFSIPVNVDAYGNLSLISTNAESWVTFQPLLQVGLSRIKIQYSQPVALNRFDFYPQQKDLGWIEVRRQRIEGGLGLFALLKSSFSAGLIPYRGAMQTLIQHKKSLQERSLSFKMPRELRDLESWNTEDSGTFQTYGGLTAFVSFGVSVIDLVTYNMELQNQFVVEMIKASENEVVLKIEEGDLNTRQLKFGNHGIRAVFRDLDGKKFRATFRLDVRIPEHHELFRQAISGNLPYVQKRLDVKLQKIAWNGKDQEKYLGVPVLIGKQKFSGRLNLKEDGQDAKLDYVASKKTGILTRHRQLQNFAYQVDTGMVVVWTTEMKKTRSEDFHKYFYGIGKTLGVKGFSKPTPSGVKFGSVISHIGLHISRKEIEGLNKANLDEVREIMKERCHNENLPCRVEKRLDKVFTKVKDLISQPWGKSSGELGILLMKEPALIYAFVKKYKYKKEVYFKFLSETYQSLEGSALIEI